MSKNFIKKIEDCFEEIEENDQIEIIKSSHEFRSYESSIIDRTVEIFNEDLGYTFPYNLKELLMFPPQILLAWRYKKSTEPEIGGEFCLENIDNSLSLDKNKVKIFNDDLDKNTKSLLRNARYFDIQPESWNTSAVFIHQEGIDFPELWLLDELELFKLELNLEGYLNALLLTKGMYYWQYLYCNKSAYQNTSFYKKQYIQRMIDYLPILFPSRDYSDLKTRYNNLNN